MATDEAGFTVRYGEWAVIAGGSDGLGAAFAERLAARGMNCLLVARRPAPLDAVAAALRRHHGVQVRTLSLDLGAADAVGQLLAATTDLDLGVVVFNAGAESTGARFLDAPFGEWRMLIDRNVGFLTEALYGFGRRMRAQARGGLIVVGSEAAFGGAARGAMYTASKGYALNLCESLWAELRPHDVDVLTLLFRIADTPTLRTVLARRGIPIEATGAVSPTILAEASVTALADGPVLNFDEEDATDPLTAAAPRRTRVEQVSVTLEGFYADVA
ncbi:SDR family NAD(P)-dependent oxidoreductase [Sphingomonas solaris]|uniref:SDR family NAD(P)-dependent oxidoreductase n=1 Tax=Alterirhizorhabdus solaris TaxID=2529389 RepID=UPI001396C672|nr:SDR family NAD(P)-dependent oxidoreductase [Sphingomonas solaris]